MSETTASDVEYPTIPAATVVLLRDGEPPRHGPPGIEVLMLRRNSKLAFAGGMWVFPGGRIDPADHVDDRSDDDTAAARRAAVREAREEAGLEVASDSLAWFSHWTAPSIAPRRFATWFFVARAPTGDITVDGGEIHAADWMRPGDALERRNRNEIELAAPTWITLEQLRGFEDVDGAVGDLGSREPEYFSTRFAKLDDGAVALYHGDAGYETSNPDSAGTRHRLWMLDSGWSYERTPPAP